MLELGAHMLPYRAYPFERALEGMAGVGFRYVGVSSEHAGVQVVRPASLSPLPWQATAARQA
jgi:hypothetical protein